MKKVAARSLKASRSEFTDLEQLPDVGPAVAAYLRQAGGGPSPGPAGPGPYAMYEEVCRSTGTRLDPCLLDTFIAAVRFMGGEGAKPWWAYTAERKRELAARQGESGQEGRP